MIWGEDDIRLRIRVGMGASRGDAHHSLSWDEGEALVKEIDKLRGALKKIVDRGAPTPYIKEMIEEALE